MALHLISSPVSPDLQRCVDDLREGVASGHITGLAIVASLRGRRFFVDVFGSLARTPHECRGMVAELDDCLREIGIRRRDNHTTRE